MMAFRIVPVLVLALAASAAQAQTTTAGDEMVVGGPAATPPPSAAAPVKPATGGAKPLTTDEQIKAWIDDAPRLDHTPPADTDAASAPRQVHGSAGVAVGSNGYRSAYVSSLIPLGKDSTLGIAVSQADYGGGTLDHGRFRLPKGRSQSLAVSLQVGNGQTQVPDGCPGFMEDGRYIAPVWWSRLHPDETCTSETDLHSETAYGQ